jgi:hypothetical protein
MRLLKIKYMLKTLCKTQKCSARQTVIASFPRPVNKMSDNAFICITECVIEHV